jgi:hypothetical protein
MDREEAKNILQLCRPGNDEDRNDPLIAEALELLNNDATLQTWFEEQQALDTQISAALHHIEPPADLKTSILVGMRAHQAQSELLMGNAAEEDEATDHSIPFPRRANSADRRSWFKPWMGVAALIAVVFAILVLPRPDESTRLASANQHVATASVPNLIEFLAQQINEFNGSKFDKRSEQINELQSHLASTGMPNPASIPSQLGELATLGCVTFDYEGTKLSMICFKNGQVYHLITANKASFPKDCTPCDGQKTKVFEAKQQAFKIWAEGEQVFILTTQGTAEDIPDFI